MVGKMLTYPVGDFLVKIKNAVLAGQSNVSVGATREKLAIAKALKEAGFVESQAVAAGKLELKLKFDHKEPVLLDIRLISRPGCRVYLKAADLRKKKGPSIYLLNSSKGVVTSKEALKLKVGGEVIAELW
ncbi:30S ribosomal protein S8 [Candidatus Woesebacteria bacterium CG_4_10_14_0_2_um_filter_44_9]|uniref:Small ribosomal subunit protein uS8 n=3 Tax=Candidatus Woeseibacteriota TaxID=1752722 RepID=A0A2M7TIU6_9BACT|nr:MAG: 30S ribosomal protein S8 [Candidatus Woesebacteria bacterium CG_4_10_14_0_2_um_filter_44_9]